MTLQTPSLSGLARRLDDAAKSTRAESRLRQALASGRVALVSSFGAESVVLLHMISKVAPDTDVLFLDTEMLFPETLRYQQEVAESLGLTNIQRITPDRTRVFAKDPDGLLHRADPDSCCALRKTEPLNAALKDFDGWITGRKRHQTAARADLPFVENEAGIRLKFNPLADWTRDDIAAYLDAHDLPRHPLIARGFQSIGCSPCTAPVAPGEDARAGRWSGQDKEECGIHIVGGRVFRTAPKELAEEQT